MIFREFYTCPIENLICRKTAVDGYFISPRYMGQLFAVRKKSILDLSVSPGRLLLLKRLDSLPVTERERKGQATPKAANADGLVIEVGYYLSVSARILRKGDMKIQREGAEMKKKHKKKKATSGGKQSFLIKCQFHVTHSSNARNVFEDEMRKFDELIRKRSDSPTRLKF